MRILVHPRSKHQILNSLSDGSNMKTSDAQSQTPLKWDCDYARTVLLSYPQYHERLGNVAECKIKEIGDGNLNFIFVVEGDKGSIVMKIV